MMWEVFMQQYSNTPEIWACNYMIGTTDNNILQDWLYIDWTTRQPCKYKEYCNSL